MSHLVETLSVQLQVLQVLLGFVTAQQEPLPRACPGKNLGWEGVLKLTHLSHLAFLYLSRIDYKESSKEAPAACLCLILNRGWELQLALAVLLSIRVTRSSHAAGQLLGGHGEELSSAPCGRRDEKETFATLGLVLHPC